MSFKAKVIKKIYLSEESGFGVFKVSIKGNRKSPQIITGNLFDVKEGDFIEISGEIFNHPKFGKQIKVKKFKSILPQDEDGIIKYLSSGRIKGVGRKTAEKIVNRFGISTFEVLENEPERLKEIKGFRKNIIGEVKKNLKDNKIIRELTVKLAPFGIGNETIFKVYKEFGNDVFEILEQNTYIMIDKIKGIGFKIADTIAKGFGISQNDPNRIIAGIHFILYQYEQQNGDLYIEECVLVERCSKMLDVAENEIVECLDNMIERNELVKEEIPEKVIISFKNFIIERMIAKYLFFLNNYHSESGKINVNFEYIFKKTSVKLTEEQKKAVISAVNNRVTIITGGPGTGKTTIIRAIIESLKKDGQDVLVSAPTGRAAKRIEETSFYQASTIHRMLKVNPETKNFVHNEHNPLRTDAIIVDESSMIDSFIFYSLLRAISIHTKLIIIGDKDQLPSVGPGNILRDIINSGYFNTIYLNRNFRQIENSFIIENAYRINNGENLIFKSYSEELDFVFLKVISETQALEKTLRIVEYYKNDFSFNSLNFQILAPMYRGESGVDNLNKIIQEKLNPEPRILEREKISFKRGDKVMQLKNNYEKEIFNGEQGIVVDVIQKKKVLFVDFYGYLIKYDINELDQLTLSYAVSIHKSQGSEYDMLILILLPSHSIMLNRELFYTAVTRAKKKIFLLSDESTIQRAIFNSSPRDRKTLLQLRLKESFKFKEDYQ